MIGKVYSCSMFFNELDLLELKLETINDLVDYFVISESTHTHSGKRKPLYLTTEENIKRFKRFEDKMIYQVVGDTPRKYTPSLPHKEYKDLYYNLVVDRVNAGNWWNHGVESYGRDTFEKESLIRPLTGADEDDIILLSDLDEIVRPESLQYTLENFNKEEIYHFQHDMFYYYLNLQKDEPWLGTIMLSFKKFLENSFCEIRTNKKGVTVGHTQYGAGWHFTFQGGAEKAKLKLESYGEQSLNLQHIKDAIPFSIENAIELNRDLFGRPCKFTLRDINDGTFPKYLVEHQNDIFKDYIRR